MQGIWITELEPGPPGRRLAVKDLFDTAGVRTTYGSAIFRDHVPERSAAAVLRLEEAGWVNVGKANLHEFAYGITSHNDHYGDVPNPRFPDRVAGGSSGGCAAALAAGLADGALGTDSGGSIRIPAACCEVVGFKPSHGLVPMEGCFPLAPSFDHAGPMATDVATCARMMSALAPRMPQRRLDSLAQLEVGVAWLDRAEPEVAGVVAAALEPFARRHEVELPLPDGVLPAFWREIAEVHRDLFARHRERYGRAVATLIERCLAIDEAQAGAAREARAAYRAAFAAALEPVDLVVVPTLPIAPPPRDADPLAVRDRVTEFTFPINAVGAPALALPCGRTRDGHPVSLQLIGRPGADDLVLAAGALLERELAS